MQLPYQIQMLFAGSRFGLGRLDGLRGANKHETAVWTCVYRVIFVDRPSGSLHHYRCNLSLAIYVSSRWFPSLDNVVSGRYIRCFCDHTPN